MTKEIHTQKHMALSDRIFIEQVLANHDSFKNITAVLKRIRLPSRKRSSQTQSLQGGLFSSWYAWVSTQCL